MDKFIYRGILILVCVMLCIVLIITPVLISMWIKIQKAEVRLEKKERQINRQLLSLREKMNELLGLLKGIAPTLATAVAGPLGGAAVTALASKFGVSDSVDAVAKAIAGDPKAAEKLQELELEMAKLDMANTADARKMNSEIQNSTTASWLAKNIAYVIDVSIIAGALTMTFVVFIVGVPEQIRAWRLPR